jgi:hypothetical protein
MAAGQYKKGEAHKPPPIDKNAYLKANDTPDERECRLFYALVVQIVLYSFPNNYGNFFLKLLW